MEPNKEQDLIEMPEAKELQSPHYAPVADQRLQALAAEAVGNVDAYETLLRACVRGVKVNDIVDIGGKPYLTAPGCQKIARLCGISMGPTEIEEERHDDGHRLYTVKGPGRWGGQVFEAIGTRSSRDKFFSEANSKAIHPNDIDMGDVKKAAFTNWMNRLIKGILGLNYTWDDFEAAGMNRDVMAKVRFRTGDKDPHAVPTLPPYGEHKGKKLDDPTVPDTALKYYLQGAERSIADPEKAKYRAKEEKLRDAIMATLALREAAAANQAGPPAPTMAEADFRAWVLDAFAQWPHEMKAALADGLDGQPYKDSKAIPASEHERFIRAFNHRLKKAPKEAS